MNAEPLLNRVAEVLATHRLEVVMVGNAAAALHGAPVTTLDIDFMFRKTPTNLKKLKGVAKTLGAVILRPYYPVSELYRVVNDERGLQLDFMGKLDGIRSFEGLKSRSESVQFGERELRIACLANIIKRKRPAGTATRRCSIFCRRRSMKKKKAKVNSPLDSPLRRESDRALVEQIRRLLALPMKSERIFSACGIRAEARTYKRWNATRLNWVGHQHSVDFGQDRLIAICCVWRLRESAQRANAVDHDTRTSRAFRQGRHLFM
jgi:hypothetical protein